MEMIMSTLAWEQAGNVAPAADAKAKSSLFGRLMKAREDKARRRVLAHLAAMDDSRLHRMGFSDGDILALRSGELRLPQASAS
jgi:hypothetical protein